MDKKNVDTSLEKPSFFEVFKARCSESDLGPISVNWFEELSSEAPLYDFGNPEDLEHTTICVNQNTFKTPKGKLPTNNQLASTPMIFKEQNKTLPLFVSPLKEVGQSKGEAGRCHHPMDSVDTMLDQSDEVVSPPFNTCLFARKRCKTPPSNKCVLSESLLRTPKLFEAQTQKCISESLGAEMDPEMSWSSSLATPPTLSPTVIIARGNDTVSGTKPHDERITSIMHRLFSKYCRSPVKNSVSVQSTSGIEDSCTKPDSEIPSFEKPIDGSFAVSRFLSKSSVNQKPPEDEDMRDTGTDSGISVCLASGKALLRKVKTVKPSQKKIFDEVEHDELQETEEAIKNSEEISITEYERELNNCKCNLQRAIIHSSIMQTCSENQNDIHIEKEIPSSLLSPWSQLDLSGLQITQLEKVSSCCSGSSSTLHVEKSCEDGVSSTDKVCAPTSPSESCIMITSNLIKTNKFINISSSEKLLAPENSPITVAIVKKSSTPVKVFKDEETSIENVSDTGSFLSENITFTDASETHHNFINKFSKENCKFSSGLPTDNISIPVASDDGDLARSGLPTRSSLSHLKRRPKKFIYAVNNTPLHQEEGMTQRDGPSAFHVSSCADFKSCSDEVSRTASRNEGQTEDTLSSKKHIIEEKREVGSEKNCSFPDALQESLYVNKSSTESHFTDLSIFPQTENKEEAVLLSNLKAANQEKEPHEQKFFAINNKDILDKDSGGKCANPANFISLPKASQLKMGNNQEVLELATQHSSASGTQIAELGCLTKKTPSVLKKNVDSTQPVSSDLKENVEDNELKWLESASSNKTQIFDGFKTASNKQITVSNNNIRKGKLLFKDIEDQFLEDFPSKSIQNISNVQENAENSSVVINNLNKKSSNFSHDSDFQVNFRKCNDAKSVFPEYANLFFQNVPKNLTASQEAEVTELSNILEETGSQFEFTQFKEQRTMLYNNNLEVPGSIDKNEISKLDINSEVWKDSDFDECIRTKVQQGSYLSPSKHIDTTVESKAQKQSRKEVTSINSLIGKWKKAHFVPRVSVPLQPHLSDLGDCCSIVNTKVNLPDEIISKAPKAVSEMGEMLDLHKTYFQSGLSERSNNYCWNNPGHMKGIDGHQKVKEVNADYMLKNNANDTITFVKENIAKDKNFNENNVVHISRTTEVNLKIVQKYSLHMTGSQLSSIENNRSILFSHHVINRGETQYNLQETLSDLTCLAEVTKTEKSSTLNDEDEKENVDSNQDQEKANNSGSAYSLQSVHTGADGSIFVEKSKILHLLTGSCLREELDKMSSPSSEKAGVAITSVKKTIDLNQNEINYQECPDIQKRNQNSAMGFYTASGKQVTVSDESLAKAKHLLSEQNIFPEKEDAFRNLDKRVIQASTKEKKDEKITKVREEFGEGTERHWREVLNPQSDFEDSLQTVNPETIKHLSLKTNASESDLISHNGRGKECFINKGSLAKNNLTRESSKNDISKMVLIDSDKEEHFHVERPGIYEKQDVNNLLVRNTSISHNACSERNSVSDHLIYISQEASSKRFNAEKNSSSSEDILKNDSRAMQNCDIKSLDANALPKNSPGQSEASASKLLKPRPVAFTTASGKTVVVSQDALTKTRELFHSNCCKPVKQNTESQSETRKHDILKSYSDVVGYGKCAVSTNCSSIENIAVENSVAPQLPRNREYCDRDEQTLQYTKPMPLDLGPESSSCFQMKTEHSNSWISNKLNADFSTDKCGFFSTASGKPVKISEESLKKSRLLFSEMEKDSFEYQSSVSDCSYGCDSSSVRDKVTSQKNKLPSQARIPANFEINSNIPCGFSTASGKQVQISEKSVQKAMGLIKEFDDIRINCSVDKQGLRQDDISPIKPSTTEAEAKIMSKSKRKEKCNAVYLSSNCTEKDLVSIKVPMCVPHTEKYKQAAELKESLPSAKEIEHLEMNQPSRSEKKCAAICNTITKAKLNFNCPTYSQIRDNYLETEASESAKAFMQDDDLTNKDVQKNTKKSNLISGETSNFQLNARTRKRQMEEHRFGRCLLGEPPIKRKLLPEFVNSERLNNSSFKVLKSTPDGTVNDRRKFTYDISLKPVICDPFRKSLTEESKKKENHHTEKRPVKVFVPPFKTKSGVSENKIDNSKESGLLVSKSIDGKEELNPLLKVPTATTKLESELFEKDSTTQISLVDSEYKDEDLTKIIANLHHARNLQDIRILKKQRQRICPQPGSLYLMKMAAAACRVPLKDAVEEKHPSSYSSEQLYSLGVSKQCMKVNSRNAEDFQFLIQEFFSREYFLERYGILLADGGYLIPTNEGKAGKEEFYQALCDTPGVDPKLISKAWVYNHYRWIIWKLAAMEVAFPQEFANKCLTPERVLLQLKYRYDVEVDRSHRSAIKRITERDDIAAKTLVLCISKIISLSTNMSYICDNKNIVEESQKKVAAVEVTDGWYGIRAILDPPLQSLLCKDKLAVGQKIIVHGAELMGSQDASSPLETSESLMLKISANSTRRTRWYSKLGYHWDPRPFCVPLSSLFSDGGTVSCIDIIIQRIYPIQWMEKVSVGSYVFRNCRAEEREAAKHAENRQKMLEVLLAKIQAEFEKSEGEGKRPVRSRTLTRQQIRSLQDGAELYEAVLNAADPAYMEGYFSKEQLKALNNHRQMVNERRQVQIEAEFRKAVESAEQDEHAPCKRDVIPVMKLRIMDYRKEGRRKEVMLNIWRPSSHVCTLLKEGGRYKIFHLTASHSKDRSETANLQLTATKKTQYLQLPVSQEVLTHVYKPRQPLQFSRLLEPSFQPTCSEVDLVGYVVCLRKGTGFSTLLYLSNENHNLIAVQISLDLKLLAIEDIVIPSALIAATNLQWRPEFRSCIPTLFAGDRSAFSSNPKESHLQGTFNELKNVVENDSCFGKDVQQRLMDLLQADGPQVFNFTKECGLDHFPSPWKPGAGNKHAISTCSSELKHPSPLTLGTLDPKPLVLLGSTKLTQELQETPKNYKKRKAIELLSQVPSPPPVKPICTLVSPLVKRAFQPPRSSAAQCERTLERRYCQSVKKPVLKTARETGFPFENNFVADEELAMINTQALLTNFREDKESGLTDEMTYTGCSDLPDRLLLRNDSSQSASRKNIMQNSSVGADAPKKDTDEVNNSLAVQKKLQRQRKPKN